MNAVGRLVLLAGFPGMAIIHVLAGDGAPLPVLKKSDVIFMYQASKAVYADYGATVLAWGGRPSPKSLAEAEGLTVFGSVGMVTEFARYYDRFPETYASGLCQGLDGKPYQVPWLTDHKHRNTPFWWCCTRQPVFKQYIRERVIETVQGGAQGVHIDDHLGTAGSLFVGGGCFCVRCAEGFREELKRSPILGIKEPDTFDYPAVLRAWLAEDRRRRVESHPVWPRWRAYQLRGAASFMAELRELAAKTAGKAVPMSANACLLWGPHLSDYMTLDFFSAEIDHHAGSKRLSDAPLMAYRMADAVGRPLASTASGGDWAFIKEQNKPGLVQGWIALGYAAGHSIMAPNRQWCYTKEKGTHWYEGPKDKFAPMYQFVRKNAGLFDGYDAWADLTVAYAQRTYDRSPSKLSEICGKLAAANLSYDLVLGGDDVVVHPIQNKTLGSARRLLVLASDDFSAADQETLKRVSASQRIVTIDDALKSVSPAVRVSLEDVRVLPRVKKDSAVIHLVNWSYDFDKDIIQPRANVTLKIDFAKLGIPGIRRAEVFAPGADPLRVDLRDGELTIPRLEQWAVVKLEQ